MQSLSTYLSAALVLRDGTNDPVQRRPAVLVEIYDFDYLPAKGETFDPADALPFSYRNPDGETIETTALFSEVGVEWMGLDYQERVLSWGPISRFLTSDFNSTDLTFANGDLMLSQFVVNVEVEGLRLVIRYIDQGIEQSIENSCIIFVGRLEKPSSIDEEECSISARQDLATINHEIPRRTFSNHDPLGRSPSDPEYEGFQFTAAHGFFRTLEVVTKRFLGFFTKKKIVPHTQQWSTGEGTSQDQVVPLIFGRVQIELIPALWADIGFFIVALWVAAGHKVSAITNILCQTAGFIGPNYTPPPGDPGADIELHLGDIGGTGTNATIDTHFPSSGALLSRTAYAGFGLFGPEDPTASAANAGQDAVPVATAIVLGEAPLPDVDNDFVDAGFTDNNSYLTRFVLTDDDILGLDESLIDDDECVLTAEICEEILIDDTSAEILALSTDDAQALTDGLFTRFNSSGVVNTNYQKFIAGDITDDPRSTPRLDAIAIEPPDDDSCGPGQHLDIVTGLCVDDVVTGLLPPQTSFYRRRYTFNAPLTAKVKAVDFLFDTLLPSFRGFIVVGPDGRLKIKTERPADSTFIRDNAFIGATSIAVNDVEFWRTSQQGLILIGVGLVTSETKEVTDATYSTVGASITLAGSGTGITLTASAGTLGGGSTTVPYSGTLTVSGTPNAGDVLTATIDGIAVVYTLTADDTLASSAAMLAAAINATWSLRQYTRATVSGAVVTVYSKLGNLTLGSELENDHVALLDSPTVAPVASATGSGTMRAGVYDLAYSWKSATGETFVSPRDQVTLTANQRISVSSLTVPTGADGVNWYLSKAPNDPTLAFHSTNGGAAFFINSLPEPDASGVPIGNGAGEESIRVMASFTQENIREHKFRWPLADKETSINQVLIKYREASDGFEERELYVNDREHQRRISQTNKVEIDGSGVDNYNQAFRLANSRLSKEREGNFFCEWDTDEAGIAFEEGDVVCITDATGGFINLPLRIESLQIQSNLDVTLVGRLYSTIMYSDQTGQHPISVPSNLRYINTAPPDADNVVLTEVTDDLTVSMIHGTFDFGEFPIGQSAHVYAILPGEVDYTLIDTVLPDPDNVGTFDVPSIGPGTYKFKIVTQSVRGVSKGLAAATEHDAIATAEGITGAGDVTSTASTSVDSEIVLFSGTSGKSVKRATITGVLRATSGVIAAAAPGTDYYAPGGTDVAVVDGGTGSSTASGARTNLGLVIGTDVAAIASPTFTGTAAAPTAAPGTNTTQLSTTAFVKAAIDVVLGGVSSAFDTLSEIATALGLKQPLVKDYIGGLNLEWVSTTSLKAKAGSAYIESSAAILTAADITKSSLSLSASTWYHVYLYDNAGSADIEIVTTAPVIYFGSARSKTGDTSRRYLGSVRTDGSGNLYGFQHNGTTNQVRYLEYTAGSPFRFLAAGSATSLTAVSAAAVAPTTARLGTVRFREIGGVAAQIGTSDDAGAGIHDVDANGALIIDVALNSSQELRYKMYAGGGSLYIDLLGYVFER